MVVLNDVLRVPAWGDGCAQPFDHLAKGLVSTADAHAGAWKHHRPQSRPEPGYNRARGLA